MVLTVTLFVLYLACVCFQRRKALSGRSLLERGFSVFQQGNGGKRWRLTLVANVSLSRVYRGRSPFAVNVSLRQVNQTTFPFPRRCAPWRSPSVGLHIFCNSLRASPSDTSGEVSGALTVQCFTRLHPSGLRERAVRSTIVDIKTDFWGKKGVFAIF